MFVSSLPSCLKNRTKLNTTKTIREVEETHLVYRDALDKKTSPKKIKKVQFRLANGQEEKENLEKKCHGMSGGTVEEKGVIRVKVKMTKQEAARLMSRCKDGGVLTFKDVAHELVQIPVNRVSVVDSNDGHACVLHSIPEEL